MAIWWMTEAVELYATALLPLVALPITGAAQIREAAAPYAHELIFLFMGGFLIALAMQRWGLHRRLALRALRTAGDHPAGIVACFMGVTAFFSMWVSNTATAVMMLPIALSIIGLVEQVEPGSVEGGTGNDDPARRRGLISPCACSWASHMRRPSAASARSSAPRPTSSSRPSFSPTWARRSASSGGWAWGFPWWPFFCR